MCKWRLFTIFMAAITVSITGFLITPGYIYKHYPLVGFYHVISHFREGINLGKSIFILFVTGWVTHGAGEGKTKVWNFLNFFFPDWQFPSVIYFHLMLSV